MKGCDELLGIQDTLKALADPVIFSIHEKTDHIKQIATFVYQTNMAIN